MKKYWKSSIELSDLINKIEECEKIKPSKNNEVILEEIKKLRAGT